VRAFISNALSHHKMEFRCRVFEALYDLQSHDDSAVAFVYCDHASGEEQTATNLMGALLGQLINRMTSDDNIVLKLHQRIRRNKLLDLRSSLQFIEEISLSGRIKAIRFCADGLDELLPEHRASFLRAVGSLMGLPHFRFLFFGRDRSGIQSEVGNFFPGITCQYFSITGDMTTEDRQLFINHCVSQNKDWRSLSSEIRGIIDSNLSSEKST
jgi:hypothetical protein